MSSTGRQSGKVETHTDLVRGRQRGLTSPADLLNGA
jgi:hypothetical protein